MSQTTILRDDYSYTAYRISDLSAGTTIDAEIASWFHDNDTSDAKSNPYPVQVDKSSGVILDGGTINGRYSLTADWKDIYGYGNSAAIRTEETPNIVIRDWRITDTWDAVRVSWGSQNFVIEDMWVTNARDDAVENDKLNTGTIRDSLFDGVLSGISLDPSSSSPLDGSDQTVTIDGVLLRMKPWLIEGEVTHGSPIKPDSANGATWTPKINITNTVFAIEDVDHNGYNRLTNAWKNLGESKNNVYLNLSDKPLPADYPAPPGGWGEASGWTLLQGQAARDYWNKTKAEWIAHHENGDSDPVSVPTPETTPEPTPEPAGTTKGTVGNDTFTGGPGKDVFVLDAALGADNIDTITDFYAKDDVLYLDDDIFTNLGSGSLSSPQQVSESFFELGEKATSSNGYLLYHQKTGVLYYDADGSEGGGPVEIANLDPGLSLTYNNFYIV